jgi:glycosyltransferase involved in cell wall biosynthesis
MKPLISVVIPAFNSGSFIGEAIESILSQRYSPIEIICVDDGSTDGTREIISEFGEKARYFYQENRGVSAARNSGISSSRGELIAFLDADDCWETDKLEKEYSIFEGNPKIGLVHTDVYHWLPAQDRRAVVEGTRNSVKGDDYVGLFFRNSIITSSVMVRRECLDCVGVFDENLKVSEDWDLWIRIARRFPLVHIPEPLVFYRVHPGSLTTNKGKMLEGDLLVTEKTLREDPNLTSRVGFSKVRKRLCELRFGMGYHYFDLGEFGLSKHYLRRAIFSNPLSVKSMTYYLAAMLPPEVILKMRRAKEMAFAHHCEKSE